MYTLYDITSAVQEKQNVHLVRGTCSSQVTSTNLPQKFGHKQIQKKLRFPSSLTLVP